MNDSQSACERCGQPALVHITNEIGQEGVVRHYCLACAARMDRPTPRPDRRLNRGAVFALVGAFILALCLSADHIGLGRGRGFGWKQELTLLVGITLVGVGTLIRASTLLVVGVMAMCLTLLADWIHLGREPGFGVKQISGSALGLVLILTGFQRVLRNNRRAK